MISNPDRGKITDAVIEELTAANILVGDVLAPRNGGWTVQPPSPEGGGTFVPYITLTPMPTPAPSGGLADGQTEWLLPYSVTSYGVTRRQVEDLSDDSRAALVAVVRKQITMRDGTTIWKWIGTTVQTIGGVGYTQAVQPPAMSQTDSVTVRISKVLGG